jgi:hypothetical protein
MNHDIISIVKSFSSTKDLCNIESCSSLYYSSKIPLYQLQLRKIQCWPIDINNIQTIFERCVELGLLCAIHYLINTYQLTPGDALYKASRNGHLKVLKYLVETFQLTAKDARDNDNCALGWASRNGHLKVLKYLVETFQLTSKDARDNDNCALRMASANGHLEVLKYLVDRFQLTPKDARSQNNDALLQASLGGHLNIVKYLIETFQLTAKDARVGDERAIQLTLRSTINYYIIEYLVEKFHVNTFPYTVLKRNVNTLVIWSP